jgi:hypothetical protein
LEGCSGLRVLSHRKSALFKRQGEPGLGIKRWTIVDDKNGARPVQGGNANSRSNPTQPEPQSHRARLVASVTLTPQLHLNHFSYEHSPSPARRASLDNAHLNAQRAAPSGEERGYSIQSIQGVAGIQDEVSAAAGTAEKQERRECSRTTSEFKSIYSRLGLTSSLENLGQVRTRTRTWLTLRMTPLTFI